MIRVFLGTFLFSVGLITLGLIGLAAVVGGVFLAKRERGPDGEREGGQFR